MKIVINKRFSQYSLSPAGVKRLAELNGKECYFYVLDKSGDYIERREEDIIDKSLWMARSNKEDGNSFLSRTPHNRADKNLVKVVEELGEKANGPAVNLKIVEIPDDVDWELDYSHGAEIVREIGRYWE